MLLACLSRPAAVPASMRPRLEAGECFRIGIGAGALGQVASMRPRLEAGECALVNVNIELEPVASMRPRLEAGECI